MPDLPEGVVAALRAELPERCLLTDPDSMARYAHDEAEWAPHGKPAAVVRASTTEQVATAVRICSRLGVPVVPRGAGTGLSGGANALDGCVLLSLAEMNRIVEINPREQLAVVQPGVVNDDLRAACLEQGAWYPPDPASSPWSTIGGNVATNAGGVCCVKYGVTRDYVLGMEAVVGDGEVVRLGRRTAKGVAGYDLCGLFVGSEGTLGVITEVTVRLLPGVRAPERTVVGYFDTLVAAGEAVAAVAAAGVVPSALELLDKHCLEAVDAWKQMGLSAEAEVLLLGRSDSPGAAGDHEVETLARCFDQAGATWSAVSTDQHEADALFQARRLAYPALERLGPLLTEDVCVPRAAVPEMLARIEASARRHDTHIANIAHAGDGNLHPLIITAAGDEEAKLRAQRAFDDIVDDAIALGGTVTGEHGVGLLKRRGLHAELSPAVVGMHHAVKNALDPRGIFNPGKVFGDPGS
ncbi:glycolate oxidase [Saccharopolyspora erythraea NRRL 2338]|uniref:FAD-binding oxidoreductase n=2 Tax=Saccharopolyspora erythraea TaxID=1836 RepID=A4FGI5_SACEN|nr:FAD-linked oxidase C-terminal domain-containing protein [Saccharopolyspora erythraea]EQD83850.1 FAD-linked oxidase [Saccharopolyspora erythraea D]PFG96864.1 glycolate oxidase [Saccharopolyspora erythraea NRRL 2338]QRK87101.1 FAD-binding protein [Saccharopolyspora erythraea]CAM03160.1 FAD-binding oxidoreductase [Saccharopolyspora erythraea NRRL 2338]